VLGDSIDYGQFRSALITIILLFVIWRLSPDSLAQLLNRLIDFAERRNSIGYRMAVISLIACWRHSRHKGRAGAQSERQTILDLEDT
jgi:hypothetical protein